MTRRFLAALAAAAVLVGAVIPTAIAANPDHPAQRIDITKRVDSGLLPRLLDKNRKITVMLQMTGDPVVVQQTSSGRKFTTVESTSVRAGIKKHQDAIVARIKSAGGRIVGQLQDAYNGIQVSVPAGKVTTLAALPGVTAVHAVATYTPSNTVGIPYVGAQQVWQDTGFTGKGVVIADIDTGLDYYHADFGGSGKPADFTYGFAHNTTAPAFNADGTTVAFPSAKVPKGYDFVGDDYNADPTSATFQPIPHPDPNPLDCDAATSVNVGHGTHTAGTAAGQGVLADGSTFTGPYDSTTYTAHTFQVGPGSAPEATLYSYRIFGCGGSSDVVDLAINQAVMDGANVINMSLGSPFGGQDDPTSVASNNAAMAGVIVVASAGNEGPSGYMVGSPGTANRVLSVAALDSEFATYPSGVVGLASGDITGVDANAGPLPVTGPLRVLSDAAGGISLGCDDADYASVDPGDIVVTERGVCARVDRATKGSAAGAAAVIMINNAAGLPPFEGDIAGVTIPFIGVVGGTDRGVPRRERCDRHDRQWRAHPEPHVPAERQLQLRRAGQSEFRSEAGRDGTRCERPVCRVRRRDDGPAPVRHLDGGADHDRRGGARPRGPSGLVGQPGQGRDHEHRRCDRREDRRLRHPRRGQRRRGAKKAVSTVALATTADKLDSLAFGYDQLTSGWQETRAFTITNTSQHAIRYDVAAEFNGDDLGTVASVWPSHVRVPGGGQVKVWLTLSLSAAAVAALPEADVFANGAGPGGLFLTKGIVTATPSTVGTGIYPLRVPFVSVPACTVQGEGIGSSEYQVRRRSPDRRRRRSRTGASTRARPTCTRGVSRTRRTPPTSSARPTRRTSGPSASSPCRAPSSGLRTPIARSSSRSTPGASGPTRPSTSSTSRSIRTVTERPTTSSWERTSAPSSSGMPTGRWVRSPSPRRATSSTRSMRTGR